MDESIGQKLRDAREKQELSLEHIAEELHIRIAYLEALEKDSFDLIPSPVQVKGFLRLYSNYLNIPEGSLFPSQISSPLEEEDQDFEEIEDSVETGSEKTTQGLFEEIGHELRHRRDVLGLSRLDIEAHTHIPAHYIGYIETGEFDRFPSPTQARGMLINYIDFLDVPSDQILLKYAEALQLKLVKRRELEDSHAQSAKSKFAIPKPQNFQVPQWVRMFLSPDLVLVSVLGVTIIVLTIWGIGRVTRAQSEIVPPPTAPSIVEALLPTPTTEPSPTVTLQVNESGELLNIDSPVEEETPLPTIPVSSASSIQVFLVIRQRTFLRVTVDGEIEYEGRAIPDDNLTFIGEESIEVLTGNAAGVHVYYNDQDLGVLGIAGEVIGLIYTREGVILPTAAPSPTLSPEEIQSETPSPTPEEDTTLPTAPNTPIP
jgi:cytoskeletal protein RodZ